MRIPEILKATRTTVKENTASVNEDDPNTSPMSFVPLMSHIETHQQARDDASFSDNSDAHGGFVNTPQCAGESFDEDGEASVQSGKTNKTAVTTSTQSLSQNLSHSYLEVETPTAPQHRASTTGRLEALSRHASDLEVFDDFSSPEGEPLVLFGADISHLSPKVQFTVLSGGVFCFSLLYGYLQELISVQICNRKLGLFLSMMQFAGYTVLSYFLRTLTNHRKKASATEKTTNGSAAPIGKLLAVPLVTYLGLSLLRAVDLAMTNMAMQYINYPAKTLMKSSRVVFTMIFGVFILKKKYHLLDYFIVSCMVAGLTIFMHADATSSAVFQPLGVIMLTISLLCDGAITNMGESIMTKYGVGQDEYIFRMYSIALVAIAVAAAIMGDLQVGLVWLLQPGTYDEWQEGVAAEDATWSVTGKVAAIVLFSTMGLLSSSCSAAITKHFGALAMSITSTARKATTLFLSFFLFNNVCTAQHIAGVVIFITALIIKSFRRKNDKPDDAAVGAADLLHQLKEDVLNLATPMSSPRRLASAPGTPQSLLGTPRKMVDVESQSFVANEAPPIAPAVMNRGTPVQRINRAIVKTPKHFQDEELDNPVGPRALNATFRTTQRIHTTPSKRIPTTPAAVSAVKGSKTK